MAWRTSYDAYGQRRNPIWGQPPPASFASKTTLGFTGHEGDDELGLVNMKGRLMPTDYIKVSPTDPRPPPTEPADETSNAADFGAVAPAADVDTTGSSAEHDPQAATTAPDEGLESSTIVRGGLGFAYGVGQAWLPGGYFVPSAQPQDFAFEFWRGAGQFTAGIVEVVVGAALAGGGGTAAGGGVAASLATGGASLLVTAAGGSAATAGWAAGGHGATGYINEWTTDHRRIC